MRRLPKQRSPDSYRAEELYKSGMQLVDIAKQLGVPAGTVRRWKSSYKWENQSERSDKITSVRNKKKEQKEKSLEAAARDVMSNESLTEEQRLFCIYYIQTFNATQSYLKAHPGAAYTTAMSNGYRYLRNPKIRAEIEYLKEMKRQVIMAGEEDIVELQMRIAFSDIGNYLRFSGRNVLLNNSDSVDTQLIQEVKEGKSGVSIKLADKQKAMDWLTQYFTMNPMDKHKMEFDKKRLELEKQKVRSEQDVPIHITFTKASDTHGRS